MTIVIARRRGSEILLLADTKVDDPAKTGPDVMPGRLKLVALGNKITVAFAGLADPAIVEVRKAAKLAAKPDLRGIVELLRQSSENQDIDYLIASHVAGSELLRVKNGVALDVPDVCAIGDDEPFRDLIEKARTASDEPLFKSDLRSRFFDRLMTNRNLGPHVGGFPIALGATAEAHRYLGQSGFYTYKFPKLEWGKTTYQSVDEIYSGEGHFQLSVTPPEMPDVPVVGVSLLQARTGYVFSPLKHDQAVRILLIEANEPWEGKEQEMYGKLKLSIAEHAAAVA
jgi:hypothetical protein